jgi:hypothetical protein
MSAEEKEITDFVAEILRDEGYRAKISSDDRIVTGTGGFKLFVIIYASGSLQFASFFTNFEEKRITPADANEFHMKYRFTKLIVDDSDNSLTLLFDFRFDKDSADARGVISWAMSKFDGALREFRDFIFEGRDDQATAEPVVEEAS